MERKNHERTVQFAPLSGGVVDSQDETLLEPSQSPDAVNVEFNRESLLASRGSHKFLNKTAPHTALRTQAGSGSRPLFVDRNFSVPSRGYAYFPYDDRYDIGGRGPTFGVAGDGSATYHGTRGKDFSMSLSYQWPIDEKFHSNRPGPESAKVLTPDNGVVGHLDTYGTYNEAQDECHVILQKGGDRLSPMSWAIGVVNSGDQYRRITGSDRKGASSYCLVFMWLDAAAWSYNSGAPLEYSLASTTTLGNGDFEFGTVAYRAVSIPHFIEPGRTYHISVDLALDTGVSGSGENPTVAWNEDGRFAVTVATDLEDPIVYDSANGLDVYKGPDDSLEYLEKYGVRYTGKDAIFAGLGMRQTPFNPNGFLYTGPDGAAIERGGHRMVDLSKTPPPAGWTLTGKRTVSPFIEVNQQYLSVGNTGNGAGPLGLSGNEWQGLEFNPEALKRYWLYWHRDADGGNNRLDGARELVNLYREEGILKLLVTDASITGINFVPGIDRAFNVYPFRWNQRDQIIEGIRIRSGAVDYRGDPRKWFSLRSHTDLTDETEPDRDSLVAYWPLNDAGGAALTEKVAGRSGYLMPYGLGVSKDGARGKNRVALSGEGEAITLDFTEDPILAREMRGMMDGDSQGFAIEITCEIPEATYSLDLYDSGADEYTADYAPDLFTWEVKDPDASDITAPKPLLRVTQRAVWPALVSNRKPTRSPVSFHALFAQATDQDPSEVAGQVFGYLDLAGNHAFSRDANWVGKTLTLQIGFEPTATPGEYEAYFAATPAGDLLGRDDLSIRTEVQFHRLVTVSARDLLRSVVTIGGAWSSSWGPIGYTRMNARMIVDEVRVYGAPAPGGRLPVDVLNWDLAGRGVGIGGKIVGDNVLPGVELEAADLFEPLGEGVTSVDAQDGSSVVTAPVGGRFYRGNPGVDRKAIEGMLVWIAGDTFDVREIGSLTRKVAEYYRITAVSTDGLQATLAGSYTSGGRLNAAARGFRLIAYTAFSDDLTGRELTLSGGSFDGRSLDATPIVSGDLWYNHSPSATNFRVRVLSSLASAGILDILPSWVRGVKVPRANPCLGITNKDERLYAAFQGAIYRADDRWALDGPTDALESCLAFRGRRLADSPTIVPEAEDRVVAPSTGILVGPGIALTTRSFDFWVRLESLAGVRTVMWVGDEDTNPELDAGAHGVNLWLRLVDGRPEIVIGSTETELATGSIPLRGLYTGSGQKAIPAGEWTHIRWMLALSGDESTLLAPVLFVNGRIVPVSIGSGSGGAWMAASDIVVPASSVALIGAARSISDDVEAYGVTLEDEYGEDGVPPDLYAGYLDGLDGCLAGLVIWEGAPDLHTSAAPFTPSLVTYADSATLLRLDFQEGVGHLAGDTGVIHSSPFLSRFHEMGSGTQQVSWAAPFADVYVANGGRVALIGESVSRFAGSLPPTTKPTVEVERVPFRAPNVVVRNQIGNDPITSGIAGEQEPHHFNSGGNVYLTQPHHTDMDWTYDAASGEFDAWFFKCTVRLNSTSGRISLYCNRDGPDSGGLFLECRDGHAVLGWYDTLLKKEVSIKTSKPVFQAGFVHYVSVRKRYPMKDGWTGVVGSGETSNWANSIHGYTSGFSYDTLVVRKFADVYPPPPGFNTVFLDAHQDPGLGEVNATSFTTGEVTLPSGCTLVGIATDPTHTWDGELGRLQCSGSLPDDIIGAQFQFGDDANQFSGNIYNVTGTDTPSIAPHYVYLLERDGTTPDFTGLLVANGGVFTGITLEKSPDFDLSTTPDPSTYELSLFGNRDAVDPTSQFSPFDGEYWSVAYGVIRHTGSEDLDIFHSYVGGTDHIKTGADAFLGLIWTSTPGLLSTPGELYVDDTFCFFEVNTRDYFDTSTFPVSPPINDDGTVEPGAYSLDGADPLTPNFLEDPSFAIGTIRLQVAFYDADQNVVSNPGPEVVVTAGADDGANVSGQVRYAVSNLPISRSPGNIERWVYASLGGGGTKFRVARIPDNTSTSVVVAVTPSQLLLGVPIEYSNGAPPQCSIVGTSGGSLWFGALKAQGNAVAFSKPYRPSLVPPGNLIPLVGSGSGDVTAMRELRGQMVIYKRDAIWKVALQNGIPIEEHVTDDVGVVSSASLVTFEDRHMGMSDRGPIVYTGQGLPVWVGHDLEALFTEGRAAKRAPEVVAAVNRLRNQYVATYVADGDYDTGRRISTEFDSALSGAATKARDPSNYRYSLYEAPLITALGVVRLEGGGIERLVAGTRDGFLVWLDHPEALRVLMGDGSRWVNGPLTAI